MRDAAEMLRTVWDRAKAEGVEYIVYRGAISPREARLAGFFHPNPHERKKPSPQIWLFSSTVPTPNNEPQVTGPYVFDVLVTLAHETGHFLSWKASDCGNSDVWQAYFAAAIQRGR